MIKRYTGKFVSTSFHGDTIRTSCKELIKLFGNWEESDPYKVNFEWNLIYNDEIPFTIYDWKEYNLKESDVVNYHIGARNKIESSIIKDTLKTYLK